MPAIVRTATVRIAGGGPSASVSFGSLPSALSNVYVVLVAFSGNAFGTVAVADNQSNSYGGSTPAASFAAGKMHLSIWEADSIGTPSGTFTVTASGLAVPCDGSLSILEVTGMAAGATLDVSTHNNAASSSNPVTVTSGTTGTTATAAELVLACAAIDGGTNPTGLALPSGYTNLFDEEDGTTFLPTRTDYLITSSTGTQAASWGSSVNPTGSTGEWAALIATFKGAAGGGGAVQFEDVLHRPALMPVFRPTAAPQAIKHGIAALLPLTIGPTVPQGGTATPQAIAAYRPAAQPSQQMRPVLTQAGAAPAAPQPVGTTAVTQALAAHRQATTVQPAKPGPAVLLPVTIGPTIPAGNPATQQVQITAALRTVAMPQQLQPKNLPPPPAVVSGTPSQGPQLPPPPSGAWPYAQFTLPTSTASAWGIPDADLVFDRLWPPIVQPSTWPYAAAQRAPVVPIASPVVGAVPPTSVLLPQGRDWPWAATMLPATPQAALLASIAYTIGPQAVPVPGAQPWPYAAMQPARAVPIIAADFVLPSITLMPQVQPWPYASTLLPTPVSAFFGITAVYGGAVPVLMGRALPFPYAATMLPTPTSSMWGQAASAVFPLPSQVLTGVIYGPNGNDYTGTLVQASGGSAYLRRR